MRQGSPGPRAYRRRVERVTGFERSTSPVLRGRRRECAALASLLDGVRRGRGAVLVLRGEAGVGKSALLDFAADAAGDLAMVRSAGVESEMELAFAALHQLCGPMLDRLDRLPGPQGEALRITFGLSEGPAPDRFLVGLAVLSLLSEMAAERPLVCLVDDVQWLDRASAQALSFAARRLLAEPVLLVFAAREPGVEFRGLPELAVEGLPDADARELLDSVVRWPLDERVREQLVAETRGNPLALLELPRELPPAQLAGGFGLPGMPSLPDRIEESFRRRIDALPEGARRLLQLAAADPVGDPALLWRAAGRVGIAVQAAAPAAEAGLFEVGARAVFRHPLVRSVAYRSASVEARRAAHRALAEATDPQLDPDRRAWHRAQATPDTDEEVAAELERSAARAQARGGFAAMAAFLARAAVLTPDPAWRADRALAAAAAEVQAGAFDTALMLLGMAEAGPLEESQRARVDLVRAQLALVSHRGSDVPALLVSAARRLQPIDVDLARATYLDALSAAMFASRLAGPDGTAREVSRAARAAPRPRRPPAAPDLLLDGLATLFTEGYAAGLPTLRRALAAFGSEPPSAGEFHWLWPACITALHTWDDHSWDLLSDRHVRQARDAGALGELPLALSLRAYLLFFTGELAAAGSLVEEVQAAIDATGSNLPPFGALGLAALRGREDEASGLAGTTTEGAELRGEGVGIGVAAWATAVLDNGLGRYDRALVAAERAAAYPAELGIANWGLVELIEAAVRTGSRDLAADAVRRLAETTTASGTDWALGVEARSRALVSEGGPAERLHRAAIERLGRTRMRADLARAHLLYGEWLRRENRRVDAREQLRVAHDMLAGMGFDGFAERARRELLATGETVRKRSTVTAGELTAQEAQIARLAREGRTNPEISTQLFISPRTVEWHMRKVFAKLGISSRRELVAALPDGTARLSV